jgi:predicted acetyltransferase
MSRIDDDIMKIDQIIGENYTREKGRSAFVVLTDGQELSEILVGDSIRMLSAVAQAIAEIIVKQSKNWETAQIVHRGVVSAMEANEKRVWEEKHGKAETAGEVASPEDQLAARIKGDATA